jgi:hypothetical protein
MQTSLELMSVSFLALGSHILPVRLLLAKTLVKRVLGECL